jgi:hypothetical protein
MWRRAAFGFLWEHNVANTAAAEGVFEVGSP